MKFDLPTLYGLSRTEDGGYKSKRVSMFPPSYTDRALARHLKRQAQRPPDDRDSADVSSPTKDTKELLNPPASNASIQTEMTYCYHQCPYHKEVIAITDIGTSQGKKPPGKKLDPQSQPAEKEGNQQGEGKNKKSQLLPKEKGNVDHIASTSKI